MKNFNRKIKSVKNYLLLLLAVLAIFFISWYLLKSTSESSIVDPKPLTVIPTVTKTPTPPLIPSQKTLKTEYHIFQTFNNCGPAALSKVWKI